jgi:hypothetical protein
MAGRRAEPAWKSEPDRAEDRGLAVSGKFLIDRVPSSTAARSIFPFFSVTFEMLSTQRLHKWDDKLLANLAILL